MNKSEQNYIKWQIFKIQDKPWLYFVNNSLWNQLWVEIFVVRIWHSEQEW